MSDLSIGGINLSSYDFVVHRIIKPLQAAQVQKTIEIPRMDGLLQASKRFTSYNYIARGMIVTDSLDDLVTATENLISFLYSDTDRELICSNQTDRYWLGQYLDSPEILRNCQLADIDLVFTCNDPLGYATVENSEDFNITTNNDIKLINNGGHYYTYPVITITFNQIQSHIYIQSNNVSGNRFDISKNFASGDELEIDCKDKTIKLNGSNSPTGFGSGGEEKAEFIKLAKGYNEIQVGTDDETINVSINLTYRKVYLY